MIKNTSQLILVNQTDSCKAKLRFLENEKLIFETDAFIGRNGMISDKIEGDGKTPKGSFKLGIAFGTHDKKDVDSSIEYVKIEENLYWVDDVNSRYYNQLVDTRRINEAWKSAEHLIDYPIQYEFAIEIKCNENNIRGKGSAVFLHCSNGKPTAGCVSIDRTKMKELLEKLKKGANIIIN